MNSEKKLQASKLDETLLAPLPWIGDRQIGMDFTMTPQTFRGFFVKDEGNGKARNGKHRSVGATVTGGSEHGSNTDHCDRRS